MVDPRTETTNTQKHSQQYEYLLYKYNQKDNAETQSKAIDKQTHNTHTTGATTSKTTKLVLPTYYYYN